MMEGREIMAMFQLLEAQGWKPMICDTPVPLYNSGVPAGSPQEPGSYDGDNILLPRELVGYEPTIAIVVRGCSMQGANIEDGDVVTVRVGQEAEDGDIVVALLDGEATLKVFFRDEDGEVWLVPQNETYQPIKVSEFASARILGRVVSVKKAVPRVSFRTIQQQMRNVKRQGDEVSLTDDKLRHAISKIARQMTTSRHWFCVYRVLVDKGYIGEGDFLSLREKVNLLLPDNDYNINPKDLSRMDVDSFHKRLFFWEEKDAPVQGKRFYEYKALAQAFQDML